MFGGLSTRTCYKSFSSSRFSFHSLLPLYLQILLVIHILTRDSIVRWNNKKNKKFEGLLSHWQLFKSPLAQVFVGDTSGLRSSAASNAPGILSIGSINYRERSTVAPVAARLYNRNYKRVISRLSPGRFVEAGKSLREKGGWQTQSCGISSRNLRGGLITKFTTLCYRNV